VKSNLFDQEATVLQFNMRAMEDREENLSFYFSLNIIANVVLGIAAIALIVIIGMGMYVTLQIILLL
jgi:hypothetical protein